MNIGDIRNSIAKPNKSGKTNINNLAASQKPEEGNKGNADSPKVSVIAHIDATEGTVEPFLAARIDSFEKAISKTEGELDVTAQLYRAGVSPRSKILKGLGTLAAHVAIPALGFMVGGVIGLAIGGVIDAGMFVLGVTRQGLGTTMSGFIHKKHLPEPDWKGKRTYTITADKTPGIDSKPSEINENSGNKPIGQQLATFISDGMKKYPDNTNIVFLAGHGFGYRQIASMPVKELRRTLDDASLTAGKKPDLIVMESCLMGNVEAMSELRNSAKVAVVSEEVLSATALPLDDMMADAAKKGGTPQEIGRRMIDIASKSEGIGTLAAIDLTEMDGVNNALAKLGNHLLGEIGKGNKPEIQAAAKEAMKFPQGKLMFLERAIINFSDLGGFADALSKKNLSDETKASAVELKKAMEKAVIAKTTSHEYSATSGLSFQMKDMAISAGSPDMGDYNSVDISQVWKNFTAELWKK